MRKAFNNLSATWQLLNNCYGWTRKVRQSFFHLPSERKNAFDLTLPGIFFFSQRVFVLFVQFTILSRVQNIATKTSTGNIVRKWKDRKKFLYNFPLLSQLEFNLPLPICTLCYLKIRVHKLLPLLCYCTICYCSTTTIITVTPITTFIARFLLSLY